MHTDTHQAGQETELTLHASCVCFGQGRGVLILGNSGTGKSSLAMELIASGAQLVSDDQTIVSRQDDALVASTPTRLAGLIEVYGVGIISLPYTAQTSIDCVCVLSHTNLQRMPEPHDNKVKYLGLERPLLHLQAWRSVNCSIIRVFMEYDAKQKNI